MSQEPNLETKYPDMKTMSRAERDNYIFQALEQMGNELARIAKIVAEIKQKI